MSSEKIYVIDGSSIAYCIDGTKFIDIWTGECLDDERIKRVRELIGMKVMKTTSMILEIYRLDYRGEVIGYKFYIDGKNYYKGPHNEPINNEEMRRMGKGIREKRVW